MFRLDADRPVEFCDGLRRRDFLHAGSLAALGLSLTDWFALQARSALPPNTDVNCILLMLIGGPSQLDTFDMKPNAPVEIRGPYKPIKTNVPGIEISENFPRTAKHADKFSLIRSVYHTAAAVHDTGHQMMQTGRLFQGGVEHPHYRLRAHQAQRAEGRRARARAAARAPSATPAATCRTARTPATWAKRTTRSSSTPTPPIRISRSRTCCRPIT